MAAHKNKYYNLVSLEIRIYPVFRVYCCLVMGFRFFFLMTFKILKIIFLVCLLYEVLVPLARCQLWFDRYSLNAESKEKKSKETKGKERGKKKKRRNFMLCRMCLCLGALFQGLAMPFIILPYPSFPTYHELKNSAQGGSLGSPLTFWPFFLR